MHGTIFKPMTAKAKPKPRKARASKRPPLAWDSRTDKPLKFAWALYAGGKRIDNVTGYSVEDGWYSVRVKPDRVRQIVGPFIVQRLSK